MLYVFHVDTGTMMTFDMNLAMESVACLQRAIAMEYPIPEEKQVLLISGGESLDPNATVGKYHAGTDTNPIFLFSKSTIEAQHPPSPSVHYGSDVDIQSQVEGSLLMPPAYGTVVSRAQLALQIHEVDKEELKACEQLVHDQHLQQQGWAAVVANLEDITSALRHRAEIFTESYNEYLVPREDYLKTLSSVEVSLQLLAKIPVLPCLLQQTSGELYDRSSSSSSSGSSTSSKSLFDWISSQDPTHSLHEMVVKCIKATEQLDERVLTTLNKDVQDMFTQVDNPSMKEVKGIEDRLYGLDQILSSARKVVQEQGDMAQGFVQNQNRVSTLKDKSILPDLCSSHKKQLLVMVQNYKKIQETKKKCKMAKEELAVNLHARLRWVMLVEKRICDVDGKLIIYHENLKRLRKRLEVLKQIHDAPDIYAQLVVEVVRRRKFSAHFSQWASSIAEESTQIHSEEYKRRETFLNQVGRHFLHTLFTGMEPFTSSFAMEVPAAVDQNLPEITEDDIEMLKSSVPELAERLQVPVDSSKSMKGHIEVNKHLVPDHPSLNTSEIEIIQSFEDRFYTADRTELSLGDQVASSELTSNLLVKSDIGVTSPTERTEFIMPKSLSEELTKEMQQASQKKLLESAIQTSSKPDRVANRTPTFVTGEVSGTSSSSGDQIKSSESDSLSHDKSTESSHSGKKQLSAPYGSPGMETSQEFTTADFYIEDSMPSSIGGTPPGTKTGEKTVKSADQTKESELTACKAKLNLAEYKLQAMRDMISNFLSELKQKCKDYGASIRQDRQNLSEEFEMSKDKMKEVLSDYELNLKLMHKALEEKFQKEVTDLHNQNAEMEKLLTQTKETYQVEQEKVQQKSGSLEKDISDLQQQLENEKSTKLELENELTKLKEQMVSAESILSDKIKEMQEQYDEMEAKYTQEITELSQQHTLEMEVELDKVRSDLELQIIALESEVKGNENKAEKLLLDLAVAEKEKFKLEESLACQYQAEKDSIKQLLKEEFNEKLSKEKEQTVLREKELLTEMEKAYDSKLSAMKETWIVDKGLEIEKIKDEMKLTFDSTLIELQHTHDNEKTALTDKHSEKIVEIEDAHSFDMRKLNEEFKKSKLDYETQLKVFMDKTYNHQEIQTESMEKSDFTNQTESPSRVSTSLQTVSDLTENQCQTDYNTCDINTQTEATYTCSETQTFHAELVVGVTQTDLREVIQVEMQTDSWVGVLGVSSTEVEEKGIQTSALDLVHGECQTDTADQTEDQSLRKTIEELEEKHQREINELITKLEKDKEDSCLSLKTSLIADRQVSFNEAVNKVCNEKDAVITELREKETAVQQKLKEAQDAIDKLTEEKNKIDDVKTRAMAHLGDKEREFGACRRSLEDEIAMLKQQLQHQQQIQSMSASAVASVMEISAIDEKDSRSRLCILEEEVKLKDEELSRVQQKLSEMTMTVSTRSLVQDKVSITSCNVGDLALFCLDERHDQYVVFTIGSTLHFLHSDCTEALGLEPAPGENRKSWVLAEITDKEYCQAKKAQNRFKVPLGTKFYRVKAKPWSRDASPKKAEASGSS